MQAFSQSLRRSQSTRFAIALLSSAVLALEGVAFVGGAAQAGILVAFGSLRIVGANHYYSGAGQKAHLTQAVETMKDWAQRHGFGHVTQGAAQ